MKKILSTLSVLALLVACGKEGGGDSSSLSVTVGPEHISAVSATLRGKANLPNTVPTDLVIGFQYSRSAGILPSNSTTVTEVEADAKYNYTAVISGLEPSTKYYFRSFVRQGGEDTYGDIKEFTTKDVSSLLETLDATEVESPPPFTVSSSPRNIGTRLM